MSLMKAFRYQNEPKAKQIVGIMHKSDIISPRNMSSITLAYPIGVFQTDGNLENWKPNGFSSVFYYLNYRSTVRENATNKNTA